MSLTPYDPFKHFSNIRRELDRFFSEFPFDMISEQFSFVNIQVDIQETDNEVIATCHIPGIERKEDLNIYVENNLLSISGTVNKTIEVNGQNMYRNDSYTESFQRTVSLPALVSNQEVKACYNNGVLEVKMLKVFPNNRNNIDIEFK